MNTPYESMRPLLTTGSIILFSGKGLVSAAIKTITQCHWSHVGMVIKLPEYDFICVWESTTLSNVDDLSTGKKVEGVQLTPLSQRIAAYEGDIAVRLLEGISDSDINLHSLMQLRKTLTERPYEQDEIELLCSAAQCNVRPNLTSIFCSELVAEAYQHMGLLGTEKYSNEYIPKDFSTDHDLKLLKGQLSNEIMIKG
jgi:hypothetical protein